MTLQPIAGFKPFTTHHCVTGSMRHIYEFHQYPISEELLLGLGAGVGFVYWHMKGAPPFYGGRANVGRPGEEGMEKLAGKRTGVAIEQVHTSSAKKAEQTLLDALGTGEPVMVQVDMGFLPYLGLPQDYHFGGHVIVVAGYDGDTEQVLVVDRDGIFHPVSLHTLQLARSSTFKPFPPANTWFTFDFKERRLPQASDVWLAIAATVEGMLHPPIANLGVKGIRTAANRTREWMKVMDDESLRTTCFNIFIYIDARGGTGGGIFRYLYGRFLSEAAQITGDERLMNVGDEMRHIGDQWQEVAQIFQQASACDNPAEPLQRATSQMLAIANSEQMVWERLQSILPRELCYP